MKINFDQALKTLDGAPLERMVQACESCGRPTETSPMTLRSVCTDALLTPHAKEDNLGGEEKHRRYKLAILITAQDEVDLPPKDIALLQELVADLYAPLVAGQVWEMLDPKQE